MAEQLQAALHGGEDYELLFTARSSTRMPKTLGGVAITRIGRIVATQKGQPRIVLIDDQRNSSELEPRGWEHFRNV